MVREGARGRHVPQLLTLNRSFFTEHAGTLPTRLQPLVDEGYVWSCNYSGADPIPREIIRGVTKTDFKSVDEYIAAQPEYVQATLERVRSAIRKAVPEAQEVISYKMPTYTLNGARLLYFAVWKQHYAIYAATKQVVAAFHDELAPYEIDKGTIRFPLSDPVPVKLIGRIAKFRAKEVTERERAKASGPKKHTKNRQV
jgi:uncharacterized protein YdhG (YjbR/CyaY superfamily)